jgi:hypothetical protein
MPVKINQKLTGNNLNEQEAGDYFFSTAIRSPDEMKGLSPIVGIVRTAIHFENK